MRIKEDLWCLMFFFLCINTQKKWAPTKNEMMKKMSRGEFLVCYHKANYHHQLATTVYIYSTYKYMPPLTIVTPHKSQIKYLTGQFYYAKCNIYYYNHQFIYRSINILFFFFIYICFHLFAMYGSHSIVVWCWAVPYI